MHPMMSTVQCHIRNYNHLKITVQTPTGMEQVRHPPNSPRTFFKCYISFICKVSKDIIMLDSDVCIVAVP